MVGGITRAVNNELLLGTREVINNVLDPTPSNALISGRGLSDIAYSVVEACFSVVIYYYAPFPE